MTINSHQDHTASYYAATANKQTVYEQLNGHKKTDVCVIGAGFTGISTALHLAERGYKVHVLEANKVGWGASGRNGGQMIGGISGESRLSRDLSKINEKIVFEMGWQGHKIIRDRVKKYNIKCDLKNGYIDVKQDQDMQNQEPLQMIPAWRMFVSSKTPSDVPNLGWALIPVPTAVPPKGISSILVSKNKRVFFVFLN